MNINQIIQEELTKMLNERDWRQPIAGHEPHSMSHTAAWLAQQAADLKGRLTAEYDLGGGEATFVPLETRTHLGADVDARNAQLRADMIAQLQGEDVPIRWPTPRSEPHPERRKILVQADSPSAQARFSPYRSEFRDLSTQEKIAGGIEATARPRAQFSPEELAAVGVTPDEWTAAGMRENFQRIIQEELTKMLNEEIQEEELPVIYRIQGFIDFLNSRDAKLVGPDEVMWRQDPRYPATKTTLRVAWQAYKKEKFNL